MLSQKYARLRPQIYRWGVAICCRDIFVLCVLENRWNKLKCCFHWWGYRLEDWRDPGAVESANHCQLKSIGIVNSQDHIDPVYLQLLEQKPNVVVDNVQNICFVFWFPWFEYSCAWSFVACQTHAQLWHPWLNELFLWNLSAGFRGHIHLKKSSFPALLWAALIAVR